MQNKLKNLLFGLLLLAPVSSFANNDTTLTVVPATGSDTTLHANEPFTLNEKTAQFPGGEVALEKYIQAHISYPVVAQQQGIAGRVMVAVEIDETGAIVDIEILQSIGGGCEEEVIRVINEMPAWTPALQAGHPVKTKKRFSFHFHA